MKKPEFIQDEGYYISPAGRKSKRGKYLCFCGNEFITIKNAVSTGNTSSCGCLFKKYTTTPKTHGYSTHRLYTYWNNMMFRCYNDKQPNYKYYGGRGIAVCKRWHSLKNFIADMGITFKPGLTLDRVNNSLGYSKENCRWATMLEQSKNKRPILRRRSKKELESLKQHK